MGDVSGDSLLTLLLSGCHSVDEALPHPAAVLAELLLLLQLRAGDEDLPYATAHRQGP